MAKSKAPKVPAPKKAWAQRTTQSGPIAVRDDVVYAPVFLKTGLHTAALDTATGEPRWLGRPYVTFASDAPGVVTDDAVVLRVHAVFGPKMLVGFDRATGALRYEAPCRGSSEIDAVTATVIGPFLFGARLVTVSVTSYAERVEGVRRYVEPAPRSRAVGLDAATGAVAYDVMLPEGMFATGAFADGETLIVTGESRAEGGTATDEPWSGRIVALDGATGAVRWASTGDLVGQGAGHGVVLADARAGRVDARQHAGGDLDPNELVALDTTTGEERFRRAMGSGWWAVPVPKGILCVTHATDAATLLDPATGEDRWSAATPYDGPAAFLARRSAAVVSDRVWITGSRDRIIGYSLADGTVSKSNIRGFSLASDLERLFVGDASSLTAYTFPG